MKFFYTSITSSGERKSGTREASDKFQLANDLKNEGETVLSATAGNKSEFLSLNFSLFNRIKNHEKIIFARNLASMLEAGLAVSRALSVIERQTKNLGLKKIVISINDDIKKGKSLSNAMKTFPAVFPPMFVSMVMSGEESGKLGDALNVVASQMEKTYLLQKKIKGAMMYPSVIIVAMLGIAVFMLMYIVPTLTKTFKEIGTELPSSTKFIIWLSDTFQAHMILVLISVVATIVLLVVAAKTKGGKRMFDYAFLHFPVVSELVKEANSARTTRTLSSLLTSGVSVVEALDITKDVLQNSYYKTVIEKAKHNIEIGAPMSEVFANASNLYPVFVGEMISVGEETGDLGGTLLKVAVFYEEEVEQKTKDMSTIIEPFLMLFVGAAVGFFAISMISPIYSVVDKI
jgi:type IV pilus assembly protein PilC